MKNTSSAQLWEQASSKRRPARTARRREEVAARPERAAAASRTASADDNASEAADADETEGRKVGRSAEGRMRDNSDKIAE